MRHRILRCPYDGCAPLYRCGGGVGADEFVPDTQTCQFRFKQSGLVISPGQQAVGKFRTVVCLDTLDGKGKLFHHMPQKHSRGIGAALLKSFDIPKPAVLIQKGVLIPYRIIT